MEELNDFLNASGYTTGGDARVSVVGLVQIALSLVGVIFFIMIFYGGYLWLTAGGNEEQVKKAQQFILRAVIGFLITLGALGITWAVVRLIYSATRPTDIY